MPIREKGVMRRSFGKNLLLLAFAMDFILFKFLVCFSVAGTTNNEPALSIRSQRFYFQLVSKMHEAVEEWRDRYLTRLLACSLAIH